MISVQWQRISEIEYENHIRVLGPSAMVRKNNSANTMAVRDHGVLDRLDSFYHQWEICDSSDPGQNIPVDKWRYEAGHDLSNALSLFVAIGGLVESMD